MLNLKKFYSIVKPGIIYGNVITVTGGFFFGAQGDFFFYQYLAVILGMSLVMASGCVYNNVIDRDIDALMQRTKLRALVIGTMSVRSALLYASVLGVLGFVILFFFTNLLATIIAFVGLFFYVVIYTLLTKRHLTIGIEIGAIAGAVPPVVGYCAATNLLDLGALSVFLVLVFWQIPHSHAIAINRLEDFKAANIPVLPLRKSTYTTKVIMLIFTLFYVIATLLPTLFGYLGLPYLVSELALGLYWVFIALKGFHTPLLKRWARQMFMVSLIMIISFSLLISLAASFHF